MQPVRQTSNIQYLYNDFNTSKKLFKQFIIYKYFFNIQRIEKKKRILYQVAFHDKICLFVVQKPNDLAIDLFK